MSDTHKESLVTVVFLVSPAAIRETARTRANEIGT